MHPGMAGGRSCQFTVVTRATLFLGERAHSADPELNYEFAAIVPKVQLA